MYLNFEMHFVISGFCLKPLCHNTVFDFLNTGAKPLAEMVREKQLMSLDEKRQKIKKRQKTKRQKTKNGKKKEICDFRHTTAGFRFFNTVFSTYYDQKTSKKPMRVK